jgi:hypothetical protein
MIITMLTSTPTTTITPTRTPTIMVTITNMAPPAFPPQPALSP